MDTITITTPENIADDVTSSMLFSVYAMHFIMYMRTEWLESLEHSHVGMVMFPLTVALDGLSALIALKRYKASRDKLPDEIATVIARTVKLALLTTALGLAVAAAVSTFSLAPAIIPALHASTMITTAASNIGAMAASYQSMKTLNKSSREYTSQKKSFEKSRRQLSMTVVMAIVVFSVTILPSIVTLPAVVPVILGAISAALCLSIAMKKGYSGFKSHMYTLGKTESKVNNRSSFFSTQQKIQFNNDFAPAPTCAAF